MPKPTELPRWADGPSAQVSPAPTEGKKSSGWVVGEKPPCQYQNWWMRLVYQWCAYLNNLTNEALTWAARHTFATGITVSTTIDMNDAGGQSITKNGGGTLSVGTDSADALNLKTGATTRWQVNAGGALVAAGAQRAIQNVLDPVSPQDADTRAAREAAVTAHANLTNPHSSASAPTPNRIALRDAAGRAQFVDPSAAQDADTLAARQAAVAAEATARDGAITTHANLTNPHSATSVATASRLMLRDASGRSQVADPAAAADIATKGWAEGSLQFTAPTLTQATLISPWTHLSGDTGNPGALKYWKDRGGIVHFQGGVYAATAGGVICTLPVGYRPQYARKFRYAGNVYGILIAPNGDVTSLDIPASGTNFFDGLSFLAEQ